MSRMTPIMSVLAPIVCILATLLAPPVATAGEVLTVLTWGGAYEASQRVAYFEPFTRETGVEVRVLRYDGGIEGLREQVASGSPRWDVVDLVAADARAACREGLLVPLPRSLLSPAPDGTSVEDDFMDGALGECWVAQLVFSTVVAFDLRAFAGEKPRRIADFFDVEHFPGRPIAQLVGVDQQNAGLQALYDLLVEPLQGVEICGATARQLLGFADLTGDYLNEYRNGEDQRAEQARRQHARQFEHTHVHQSQSIDEDGDDRQCRDQRGEGAAPDEDGACRSGGNQQEDPSEFWHPT